MGEPNELSVYADVEAAFAYLRDVIGVPWQEVILYGRSVGSGPSVHLASRTAVRAMVLQSPLLSIYRIAFHSRFTLPGDMFTNVDEIVPFWHGEDLVRNCQEGIAHAPFWVEDGGHNDLEMKARQPFYDNFAKFLHCVEQEPVSEALMLQAAESPI